MDKENSFRIGDVVEFKDKSPGSTGLSHDGIYKFLGECEMKDSSLGWIKAVQYIGTNAVIYIREKEDFYKKFKKCNC